MSGIYGEKKASPEGRGVEAAKEIMAQGLCLEEYAALREHQNA